LTDIGTGGKILAMGQAKPTCPNCGADLILALPPGGKGRRALQCFDCDRPDPMKTERARGWLSGELGRTGAGGAADLGRPVELEIDDFPKMED